MKFTPNSMARRRTAIAVAGSLGGPQIPSPVRRIAPKPRRLTVSSPPSVIVPAFAADGVVVFMVVSFIFSLQMVLVLDGGHSKQQRDVIPSLRRAPTDIARFCLYTRRDCRRVRPKVLF